MLDLRLPGINGFETFKIVHAIEPKLPVIIMTAFGTTETAIETTRMGAFDYVLKPFGIPEMLDEEGLFDNCMDEVAGLLVREALRLSGGNRSQAAHMLGLSRPTFHTKIDKFGLKLETKGSHQGRQMGHF